MAELLYTEAFVDAVAEVANGKLRAEIRAAVELLADFPDLGSCNLPSSIAARYGEGVRKLVASRYDIVYEHDEKAGTVLLLALLPQRQVW